VLQVVTLESWAMGIARPVMVVYPYAWTFFIPFIMLSTWTVLNLFIGVVVNTIGEIAKRYAEVEEARAKELNAKLAVQ
jgi:voltage-gated sodium channel